MNGFNSQSGLADDFSERTEKIIARVSPRPRDIQNLQNWVENTGLVVEEETLFLDKQDDLLSLGSLGRDEVVRILEGPVEDAIIWLRALRGSSSVSSAPPSPSPPMERIYVPKSITTFASH